MEQITIKEVAKLCGVGVSTVSRAINNHPDINPETKQKILDTIREYNYVPVSYTHLSQIGGITPARKLIALCDAFGIRTAWHGPIDLTPIGHAVNIHLDMASPNFGIQEWADTNTLSEDAGAIALHQIFTGIPEMRDGYLYLNGKPGIGVDIDEKAAAEYPCSEEVVTWDWMLPRLPDGTAVRP